MQLYFNFIKQLIQLYSPMAQKKRLPKQVTALYDRYTLRCAEITEPSTRSKPCCTART